MTTTNQDRDFIKNVLQGNINDALLGDAIDWIRANLEPDDVFPEKPLQSWAENNGYILEKDFQK